MTKKKKVTFMATKRVPKKIPVSFESGGKRVSFHATKRVPKKVRVEFYAKSKKRK